MSWSPNTLILVMFRLLMYQKMWYLCLCGDEDIGVSLFQSKFCTTSNRSTSGCRSGDTWTAPFNRWTAALPSICRTFTVDQLSQVSNFRWLALDRDDADWSPAWCPSSGCGIFACTAPTWKDKASLKAHCVVLMPYSWTCHTESWLKERVSHSGQVITSLRWSYEM